MSLTVAERYGAAIIQVEGKFLGSLQWDTFRETLYDLRESGKKFVVVDLSKTDFIDSTGLGILISGLTSMRRAGGDLRLAGLQPRTRQLFTITQTLGTVFQEYLTVDDAEMSYRTHPPAPPIEA